MLEKNIIGIRNGMVGAEWPEAFDLAAQVGAECIEIDVPRDFEDFPLWTEDGRAQLKALEEKSGVKLVSMCLGAFWQHSPSNPDATVRATATKLWIDTIKGCEAMGIPYILAPLTHHEESSVESQRDGWKGVLKEVSAVLPKYKVQCGLELCARDFAHSAQDALDLLNAAEAPANLGVYFDTANGMGRGHIPEQDIPALAKAHRLTIVHIKDTKSNHLGEGDVNFAAVKQALIDAKYEGPFVLETPGKDDPLASSKLNLDYTKKLFRG